MTNIEDKIFAGSFLLILLTLMVMVFLLISRGSETEEKVKWCIGEQGVPLVTDGHFRVCLNKNVVIERSK